MNFVKLHHKDRPTFINLDSISQMELSGYGDGTRLIRTNGDITHVDETPEEILAAGNGPELDPVNHLRNYFNPKPVWKTTPACAQVPAIQHSPEYTTNLG